MIIKKKHDNVLHQLALAGLSESEAAFYLAAVQLGRASVRKIASKAGLNRSSSYAVFDHLKSRGLVSAVKKGGKNVIEPIEPWRFLEKQKEQLVSLEQSIEELNDLFRVAQKEPGVKFSEGEEGLKNVLKMILEETKEVCIFGDGDAFKRAIPGWTERYSLKRADRGIKARVILRGTSEAIASLKKLRNSQSKKHELTRIHLFPEAMNIVGGFDVYGTKTILYSFDEKNVAVVIESVMISKMMKSIFEILWSLAETYDRTLLR